jgi:hypothetical protein
MAKPRKLITKSFQKQLIDQLREIHPTVQLLQDNITDKRKVEEFLKILNAQFSAVEIAVRNRQRSMKTTTGGTV